MLKMTPASAHRYHCMAMPGLNLDGIVELHQAEHLSALPTCSGAQRSGPVIPP
jgi:hypothetical protein